jgi:uncharacterized RDD family membrane protein YckC
LEYAGFWIRTGAYLIDLLFLSLVMGIFTVALFLGSFSPSFEQTLAYVTALCAVTPLYFIIMEGSPLQGTVGKRVSGLRVTNAQGARISIFRSILRTLAKSLSGFFLGIGYLMVGTTERKQGLHDKIADCYVLSYRKSRFWGGFFLLLILCGALSAGGGTLASHKMQRTLGKGLVEVLTRGGSLPLLPLIEQWAGSGSFFHEPDEETLPGAGEGGAKEVIDLAALPGISVADYEEMLAMPARPFTDGLRGQAGPFALQLRGLLWGTTAQHELTVRMASFLPPAVRRLGQVLVSLTSVKDTGGQEMADTQSFPDEMFNDVEAWGEHGGAFEGTYDNVRLLRRVKDAEIGAIEGKVVVRLPVGMRVASFEAGETGVTRTLGDVEVTFREVTEDGLTFALKGTTYRNAFILGLNGEGEVVEMESSAMSGGEDEGTMQVSFKGETKMLHVVVAKSILTRELPFVMGR